MWTSSEKIQRNALKLKNVTAACYLDQVRPSNLISYNILPDILFQFILYWFLNWNYIRIICYQIPAFYFCHVCTLANWLKNVFKKSVFLKGVVSEIYPYPPSGRSFEIPWEWQNSEAKNIFKGVWHLIGRTGGALNLFAGKTGENFLPNGIVHVSTDKPCIHPITVTQLIKEHGTSMMTEFLISGIPLIFSFFQKISSE